MEKTKTAAPGAGQWKELLKYIDYLVAARGGGSSAFPLNEYRLDAMRGKLVRDLVALAKNHDPEKVPEFVPFAKAMLKRSSRSIARSQVRAQLCRSEGAYGYASLDAPVETSNDAADATLHDCIGDAGAYGRGVLGERLRRFYRVLAALPAGDRRMLAALLDCGLSAPQAAVRLGMAESTLRRKLKGAFARFRAIWRVVD